MTLRYVPTEAEQQAYLDQQIANSEDGEHPFSQGRADGSKRHFIMMRDGPDARPAPHFALNKPHFTPGVSSKRLGAG